MLASRLQQSRFFISAAANDPDPESQRDVPGRLSPRPFGRLSIAAEMVEWTCPPSGQNRTGQNSRPSKSDLIDGDLARYL